MSEAEFKFPEWQSSLQELLLEFDSEKLNQKTHEVETMLLSRLEQLNQGRNDHGERDAIFDALRILRIIKRDKLGFPDWQ